MTPPPVWHDPADLIDDLASFLAACRKCSWFDAELHARLVAVFSQHDRVIRRGPVAAALAATLLERMRDLHAHRAQFPDP